MGAETHWIEYVDTALYWSFWLLEKAFQASIQALIDAKCLLSGYAHVTRLLCVQENLFNIRYEKKVTQRVWCAAKATFSSVRKSPKSKNFLLMKNL